jgi:RNA polymerase sigma factor (sigma-70 family)
MKATILPLLVHLSHHLAKEGAMCPLDDGELLARFAAARDEAAFAALLDRHGRLVWCVCRGLLANDADAEDVFQATFVALFRGAATIRQPRSVAPWLHSTATRIARKVRLAAARRNRRERQAARAEAAPGQANDDNWHALHAAVHDEIARLPATLRAAFVLCVLEGHRHQDAAARLGVPTGTVSARVSRARRKLLDRLRARGLTPVVAVSAVACAAATGSAAPPTSLRFLHRHLADGFASVATHVLALAAPPAGGMSMTGKGLCAALLMLATIAAMWVAGAQEPANAPAAAAPAHAGMQPPPAAQAKQPGGDRVDGHGDPLPAGALFRFGSQRGRHDALIRASAVAPDGKTLATASGQSVILWDLATGKLLYRFNTEEYWPFSRPKLVFSPDGSRLGYVHSYSLGCVWDVKSGKEVARFERQRLAEGHCRAFCQFTPDGKQIVVGEGEKTLVFWDLEANRESRRVAVENVFLLSPDARTCVRVETPSLAVVFCDAQTGKQTGRWDAVSAIAGSDAVAFAPDGQSLAVVHGRKEIQVRDFPGGGLRVAFPLPGSAKYLVDGGEYWEYQVRFSADGKTLVLATHGGVAHRWDLATGKELLPLKGHVGPVTGIHVHPDHKTVITTSEDGLIRRWDAQTGKELSAPAGYAGSVQAAYSPDGRLAAVGDGRGRLELWEARAGKLLRTLRADGPAVAHLTFTPDSKALAVALANSTVHFWAALDGKEQRVLRFDKEQNLSVARVMQFSPDGRLLLLSDQQRRACVWDLAGEKVCWKAPFGLCAFSADGATVVGDVNGWQVRDAKTGKLVGKLALGDGGFGGFYALACSPDGQFIAAGRYNGTVTLCPTTATAAVATFKACDSPAYQKDPIVGFRLPEDREGAPIHALAFSPDGRWLCTSGADGSVRLWEVASRGEVLRLPGHAVSIRGHGRGVSFGADSRNVLTWGPDAQVYLWSLRPPTVQVGKVALESLWAALADEPATAYRAVWQLSEATGAAAFLRGKIVPAQPVADERLQQLIADLGSDQFAVRQAASQALAELHVLAVPAMRKALAGNLPLEPRKRLQTLVNRVETRTFTVAELRVQRAIAALEMQATAEARQVLEGLAAGAAGALPTTAARAALVRLQR